MIAISIIGTLLLLFTVYKAYAELRRTLFGYDKKEFVEDSVLKSNQHVGGLLGIVTSISLFMIVVFILNAELLYLYDGGLWIPSSLSAVVYLYIIEHCRQSRIKIVQPIYFIDLFRIYKIKIENSYA